MGLTKRLPFPPFLTYDALNEDIPGQFFYEQIKEIDEKDNQSACYDVFKGFLQAVHISQKVSATTVMLPAQLFEARATW